MDTPLLQTVEVRPAQGAAASVIWLHGLGADGHDFEPIVPELGLAAADKVRFVFPHAPVRPVTVNGGFRMRAWYDIVGIGPDYAEDGAGMRASAEQVQRLIEREESRGVAPERVVLAGFSQGGAIALQAGLRQPRALAGIMALSTYLPLRDTVAAERTPAGARTPVFMAHGQYDQVVPFDFGRRSRDLLLALEQPLEWREYPMEHSVVMEEIRDIAGWLRRVLGLSG